MALTSDETHLPATQEVNSLPDNAHSTSHEVANLTADDTQVAPQQWEKVPAEEAVSAPQQVANLPAEELHPAAHIGRFRDDMRRQQRRKLLAVLSVIFGPVILAAIYANFFAARMYMAESRFVVRASEVSSSGSSGGGGSTPPTSLLAASPNPMSMTGFTDGYAVRDFLTSREAMVRLDKLINLRKFLSHRNLDPLNQVSPNADEYELYRAYLSDVTVYYNMIEQIVVMDVWGYSPQDTNAISNGLIKIANDFVDRMNQRGIADAVKVANEAMALAQTQDVNARAKLEQWRIANSNVDPTADTVMLFNLLGQQEAQLATARVNLANILAFHNPNHPLLRSAELQVAELSKSVADTRQRLSGNGVTETAQLKTYEALKGAQDFADSNLANARQAYEQARTNSLLLQRYLSVIASPVSDDEPDFPNQLWLLSEAFATGLALAFFGSVGIGFFRAVLNA